MGVAKKLNHNNTGTSFPFVVLFHTKSDNLSKMLIESNDPRTVSVMNLLQHLNTQELKDLLNEDARFETIIKDSDCVKQQESEKDMLLVSNKSLAEYNLSFEPKLSVGRQKLVELHQTASQLEKSLQEKEASFEESGGEITLDTAIALLQTAAVQAEEESEALANNFLDQNLDVETFVDEFQHIKKVAHLRRVKSDKINEPAIKKLSTPTPTASPFRPAPPVPNYFNQSSSVVPPSNPPTVFPPSLPYPIFPPNQPQSSLPYPAYSNQSMFPHHY